MKFSRGGGTGSHDVRANLLQMRPERLVCPVPSGAAEAPAAMASEGSERAAEAPAATASEGSAAFAATLAARSRVEENLT